MTIVYDDTHVDLGRRIIDNIPYDLGRSIINNIPCATYGVYDSGGGVLAFPANAVDLAPGTPYYPINFLQLNTAYVSSSMLVVANSVLVSTFNPPYNLMPHLNAILLNRNGPYGFCSWRQLDFHSYNKDAYNLRKSNRLTITTHNNVKYSFFESPLAEFSMPSEGKLKFVEKFGPDFLEVGSGFVFPSFSNEIVQFEHDDLYNLVKVPPIKSGSMFSVKEMVQPTKPENKTGFSVDFVTKKEIVTYRGNPERRVVEKSELSRIKTDGSAFVDYLWFGEVIFPKREKAGTKTARVRGNILNTEDWRVETNDLEPDYGIFWRGTKYDLLRPDFSENSQREKMSVFDVNYATFNRWPLFAYKNGYTDDIIFSIDPVTVSEAGELLGGGVQYNETGNILYVSLWYTFFGSRASTWAHSVLGLLQKPAFYCDAMWRAHQQSGKMPFYGTFEKFFDNAYPHSKGYSLIPEWTISENLTTVLEESDCVIFGSDETDETFGGCDFYALEQFKDEVGGLTRQKSIKFVFDVFKKFLPYRGFYPADRSVQIGTLLHDSYVDGGSVRFPNLRSGILNISETNNAAKQTFLSHLMGPGIFFNTLKAGVGVGFPVFNGAVNKTNASFEFFDFSYSDDGVGNTQNFCFLSPPSFYLPFESLLDLKKNLMPVTQVNMVSQDLPAVWTGAYTVAGRYFKNVGKPQNAFAFDSKRPTLTLFERANHNFLSEVERFYLKNKTNTYFTSKPESEFKEMVAGSVYYMDVVLKQRDCVLTEGPAYGSGVSLRGMVYGGPFSMSSTSPQVTGDMASEDSIARIFDITDPSFGPFCPPYFYGNAVARISFDPVDADPNLAVGQSKKFTLDEILKHSQTRTLRHTNTGGALERSGEFYAYPGADDSINDFNGLYHEIEWSEVLNIAGNSHVGDVIFPSRASVVPFMSTILQAGMMDIDQSIELFNKRAVYNYEINKSNDKLPSNKTNPLSDKEFCWCINTKFETPVLDYSMHTKTTLEAMPVKVGGEYLYQQNAERTRGVWLDYGALPRDGGGLFLEIRESFPHKAVKNQKIFDYDNNIIKNIFEEEPAITLYFDAPFYQYLYGGDDIDITCHLVANFDGVLGVLYDAVQDKFFIEYTVGGVSASSITVQKGVIYDVHFTAKMLGQGGNYRNCKFEWTDDISVYSETIKFEVKYTSPGDPTNGINVTQSFGASSVNKLNNFIVAGTFNRMMNRYEEQFDLSGNIIPKFESLIDVCGFEVGEKSIGNIAEEAEIKEAVVVVPYIEVNGEREYFEIDSKMMDLQKKNMQDFGYAYKTIYGDIINDTTITRLLSQLERYVFPPKFDFVRNRSITPIVMYVAEVRKLFEQEDLVDLWQNLLPDALKKAENEKIEVSHELEEYEFFHGREIPNDIKFLVFKVKQKGAWNYYLVKPNNNEAMLSVSKNNKQSYSMVEEEKYNYNWPYDFCSIVEYGKIACHIKFDGI